MEFLLGTKEINASVLEQEMSGYSTWQGFKGIGDTYHAIVTDLSEQSAIQATFDAHDANILTPEQEAEIARKALSDGATFSKLAIPLIKTFNDALEVLFFNGTIGLANAYTSWRTIFDALPMDTKMRIIGYNNAFNDATYSLAVEPDPLTDDYRVWFNRTIRDFLEYITDRSQY